MYIRIVIKLCIYWRRPTTTGILLRQITWVAVVPGGITWVLAWCLPKEVPGTRYLVPPVSYSSRKKVFYIVPCTKHFLYALVHAIFRMAKNRFHVVWHETM